MQSCIISTLDESIIHELGTEVTLDILCIHSEEEVIWFSDMSLYVFPERLDLSLIVPIWTQYDDCIIRSQYPPK
ncbi:MAG: hypothetical protein WAW59_01330 [Patescibacteria group bacterium]